MQAVNSWLDAHAACVMHYEDIYIDSWSIYFLQNNYTYKLQATKCDSLVFLKSISWN